MCQPNLTSAGAALGEERMQLDSGWAGRSLCNFMGADLRSPLGKLVPLLMQGHKSTLAPGRPQSPCKLHWMQYKPTDLPAPAQLWIVLSDI